jgi:hypothetical protein
MKDVPGRHNLVFFNPNAKSMLLKNLSQDDGCRFIRANRMNLGVGVRKIDPEKFRQYPVRNE